MSASASSTPRKLPMSPTDDDEHSSPPASSQSLASDVPPLGAIPDTSVDPIYAAKAHALNAAIQEIGMGRYQWGLFCVAGFGWFVDNLWPQATALILPAIIAEMRPHRKEMLALAQNLGLMIGASFWGVGADIIGRRWAFNLTLLIAGVFGAVAGGSSSYTGVAVFAALWSVGVGGNLPVDSAVLLEFLPGSHQWVLTAMSLWWGMGQIVASAVAWPLLTRFSCPSTGRCDASQNMGWRYLLFTLAGLTLTMALLRVLFFRLYESPKYLMGRGNDPAAASVIAKLSDYNGHPTTFTAEALTRLGTYHPSSSTSHIRALFSTPMLSASTSTIILLWFLIGTAFPLYNCFLPYFLSRVSGSTSQVYRNYLIIGVCSLPGSLLGATMIELPSLGRKGAMSLFTLATGAFLFAATTARTGTQLLAFNAAYAVTSSAMYAVLYAYTPEVFPTKDRGTGSGLAATANRIGGVLAPLLAMAADLDTPVPVYVSGSMFLCAGVVMLWLPFESRGKTSL